ncbi:hypothetical protein J2046_006229 [Rhizobium petrolearium]|nr:hypothetical protein [Neorhizobium petrolearium]
MESMTVSVRLFGGATLAGSMLGVSKPTGICFRA